MSSGRVAACTVQLCVGALFVVSALAKYVALGEFELYLYSFRLLSLNLSFLLSRCVVAGELLLGVALIANRWHRVVSLLTILLLSLFTVFLCVVSLVGRTDSCHCMGELMRFSPTQSMLKNAVLMLATLFFLRRGDAEWRPAWWLAALVAALSGAVLVVAALLGWQPMTRYVFRCLLVLTAVAVVVAAVATLPFGHRRVSVVLSCLAPFVAIGVMQPPDNWFRPSDIPLQTDLLERQLEDNPDLQAVDARHGRKLLAFYSTTCHYCQQSATKVGYIQQRHQLPSSAFVNVFATVGDSAIDAFYLRTGSPRFASVQLPNDTLLYLTYGSFPTLLLLEEGEVRRVFDFREIDEQVLVDFLQPVATASSTKHK